MCARRSSPSTTLGTGLLYHRRDRNGLYHRCDRKGCAVETVLNILLIRFGIIAGIVVVVGLGAFALIVSLRRRGKGERVREGAAVLAKSAARAMDRRGARGVRGRVGGEVVRQAARWLDEDPGRKRPGR
ncbi:hypothetical protein G3I59_03195 [Amycolatopsis rubida]|uniref:Uncharacterized protein n=1 Tax=Amycolatopsis rubida TaxID=112413 RepID=A0ABX0BJJ8_9PSEU|nr:hypothetical protein [Amycolatopsis rubida]NEC54629.1 hypothetical protein [Amycolatopsis rubida]